MEFLSGVPLGVVELSLARFGAVCQGLLALITKFLGETKGV
jgi:hypothetical protein